MADPLALSSDPDIPTPTLDDLVRLVYGPHREDVRRGTADARLIQTLLQDARKQWDEGHKRDATARRAQSEQEPPTLPEAQDPTSSARKGLESFWQSVLDAQESEMPRRAEEEAKGPPSIGLPLTGGEPEGMPPDVDSEFPGTFRDIKPLNDTTIGTHVAEGQRAPTEQEQSDAEFLDFMSEQVRASYEAADADQKTVIWEANKRAFEAAKRRKEAKLLREQQRMEKVLDMLQRMKEDPRKADLLPPDNASIPELHDWYDRMSQPVHPVPFGNPSGRQIRRERMERDTYIHGHPDPSDIAAEEEEQIRYRKQLEAERDKVFRRIESELAAPPPKEPPMISDNAGEKARPSAISVAGQIIENTQSKPSLWDKIWKLAESNFFMGGGVATALVAYGFILAGAPRFGFFLLLLAWFVMSISIWRHRFFEGRSNASQIMRNLITCGLVGIALLVIWVLVV